MMADLNALLIFAQVIEAGSFAKASRNLKMPTSTVSRRVAELEEQLRVRLLERSTRSLKLTQVGAEVLEHAQQIAALTEAVEGAAAEHTSSISGTLRLSAPPSISDSLLVPMLQAFQSRYPEVSAQVFITERVVDPVMEGVDLAFRVVYEGERVTHSQPLLRYRHLLVGSPAYLAAHGAPQHPDDLLQHKLLTFSFWRPRSTWVLENGETGQQVSLQFEPHLAINEYSGLIAGLIAGIGIGELPPIVQPHLLRNGTLSPVLEAWQFRPMQLCLQHLGKRHVPRQARAFQEFAVRFTAKLFPEFSSAQPPAHPAKK